MTESERSALIDELGFGLMQDFFTSESLRDPSIVPFSLNLDRAKLVFLGKIDSAVNTDADLMKNFIKAIEQAKLAFPLKENFFTILSRVFSWLVSIVTLGTVPYFSKRSAGGLFSNRIDILNKLEAMHEKLNKKLATLGASVGIQAASIPPPPMGTGGSTGTSQAQPEHAERDIATVTRDGEAHQTASVAPATSRNPPADSPPPPADSPPPPPASLPAPPGVRTGGSTGTSQVQPEHAERDVIARDGEAHQTASGASANANALPTVAGSRHTTFQPEQKQPQGPTTGLENSK